MAIDFSKFGKKVSASAKATSESKSVVQPTPVAGPVPQPKPAETPAPAAPAVTPAVAMHKADPALIPREQNPNDLEAQEEIANGPMGFQDRLDKIDLIMSQRAGITDFNYGVVRQHVKVIMVEMKENPELDSMFADRDAHNFMRFIRHTSQYGKQELAATAERKEKKLKKPRVTRVNTDKMNAMFGDFGNMSASIGVPKTLDEMASQITGGKK